MTQDTKHLFLVRTLYDLCNLCAKVVIPQGTIVQASLTDNPFRISVRLESGDIKFVPKSEVDILEYGCELPPDQQSKALDILRNLTGNGVWAIPETTTLGYGISQQSLAKLAKDNLILIKHTIGGNRIVLL